MNTGFFILKVVFGIVAILTTIKGVSMYLKSYRKAKNEIKYRQISKHRATPIENEQAVLQAKTYFDGFQDKSYNIGEHLKSDQYLPVTFNPKINRFIFVSIVLVITGVALLIEYKKFEMEIFQFIPLGGIVKIFLGLLLISFGIWMALTTINLKGQKITLDKEKMIIKKGGKTYSIGYVDCHLIVTASNHIHQLNLLPNNSEMGEMLRIVGFVDNKKIAPILITKFIEYGNFHQTTEFILDI